MHLENAVNKKHESVLALPVTAQNNDVHRENKQTVLATISGSQHPHSGFFGGGTVKNLAFTGIRP